MNDDQLQSNGLKEDEDKKRDDELVAETNKISEIDYRLFINDLCKTEVNHILY